MNPMLTSKKHSRAVAGIVIIGVLISLLILIATLRPQPEHLKTFVVVPTLYACTATCNCGCEIGLTSIEEAINDSLNDKVFPDRISEKIDTEFTSCVLAKGETEEDALDICEIECNRSQTWKDCKEKANYSLSWSAFPLDCKRIGTCTLPPAPSGTPIPSPQQSTTVPAPTPGIQVAPTPNPSP